MILFHEDQIRLFLFSLLTSISFCINFGKLAYSKVIIIKLNENAIFD